jgi:hypothetical protein
MNASNTNTDLEHLRLLSIFHYIVGGLAALFSLFPIIHLVMGIAMVTGRMDDMSDQPEAALFGWFFIVMAAGAIAVGMSFAACLILAGRFLARRVYYTFCFIMAALSCVFVPFGTVLGIFTIIVLVRPGVKEMFSRPAP